VHELLLGYGRFVKPQADLAIFCYGTLAKEAESLPLIYVESSG